MKRLGIFSLVIALALLAGLLIYWQSNAAPASNALILYGNVDVRQVDLGFQVSGRVVEMLFEEGDYVQKDQLVAVLDIQPYADKVKQAQAAENSIRIQFQNAVKLLNRRLELIGDGSVSKEDLENSQTSEATLSANLLEAQAALGVAQTDLNHTRIYAPSDAIILTRVRECGTVVREADPVYTLSIISPVWIRAFIPEKYLGVVYPGMPAEVFTDTPGGKSYQATVGFVSPVAEFTPKTVETTQLRTDLVYRLRIYASNPDRGLRQGMPVTVKLNLPSP